jgi:hypothetical protein
MRRTPTVRTIIQAIWDFHGIFFAQTQNNDGFIDTDLTERI